MKKLILSLVAIFATMGVWAADYEDVFSKSSWTDADKTDWNASSAVNIDATKGIGANANLTATYISKSFDIEDNAKVKYEISWTYATATGRTGNYNWIQIGDLRLGINSSYNMYVSTDGGATYKETSLGYYYNATYTKDITVIFDKARKSVESLVFDGTDRTNLVSGDVINNFNTVSTGFTRGGSVSWTLVNYLTKIKVSQQKQAVSKADYTVMYLCNGQQIKSNTGNGVIGTTPSLDKNNFFENASKYIYVSDDAEGKTIASDGTTVYTINYRQAAVFSLRLNANIGNRNLGSASAFEGEKATSYFPYYIYDYAEQGANEKTLFATSQSGYGYKEVVLNNNEEVTIEYTKDADNNCVFFSEAENISALTPYDDKYTRIRMSNGMVGYAATDKTVLTTLPSGVYTITSSTRSGSDTNPATTTFYAGDEEILKLTGTGAVATALSPEFTVKTSAEIKVSQGSTNNYFDYVLIRRIRDYVNPATDLLLSTPNDEIELEVGKEMTIGAQILPQDATDTEITWKSNTPEYATVDATGKVTGVAVGYASIEAKCGQVTKTIRLIVCKPNKTMYAWSSTGAAAADVTEAGGTVASVGDKNGTTERLNYKISVGPSGNTVDYYTMCLNGKKAKVADASNTNNSEPSRMEITFTEPLKTGDKIKITAFKSKGTTAAASAYLLFSPSGKYINGTDDYPDIKNGGTPGTLEYEVPAGADGTTKLTLTRNDNSTNLFITKIEILRAGEYPYIPVSSVELSTPSNTIEVRKSVALTATVLPDYATDKTVTFSSSDTKVAKVSEDGIVTGKSVGTARITAKCGDLFNVVTINVVPSTTPAPVKAHTWDFTYWSDETLDNLESDVDNATTAGGWTNFETVDKPAVAGCYWQVIGGQEHLSANAQPIEELEGLEFMNTAYNRAIAIATDYPSTTLGTYHGGQYLWLCGTGSTDEPIKYFTIKHVKAGSTIKMGVESHKTSEARGVRLAVDVTDKALTGPTALPTTFEELSWQVPEAMSALDIVVSLPGKGCHIYYIDADLDTYKEEATSIKLSVDGDAQVEVGKTLATKKVVEPTYILDQSCTYKSLNEDIATVDENGVITGVAVGTAEIVAYINDAVTDTLTVEVVGASVDMGEASFNIAADATVELDDFEDVIVSYENNNVAIALADDMAFQYGAIALIGTEAYLYEDGVAEPVAVENNASNYEYDNVSLFSYAASDLKQGKKYNVVIPAGGLKLVNLMYFMGDFDESCVVWENDNEMTLSFTIAAAKGQKTIYSWESADGNAVEEGGSVAYVNGDGNRVNYANGVPETNSAAAGKTYYTICLNGKKGNLNDATPSANAGHMVITFDEPLKAGDKIEMTAYYNKVEGTPAAPVAKEVSPYFLFNNGASFSGTVNDFPNIANDGAVPTTVVYEVPAAADGATSLTMTREKTGTNLFITKLVITGAREQAPVSEPRSWDFTKVYGSDAQAEIAGATSFWGNESKGRLFYLVAANDEYLQGTDGPLSVTKDIRFTVDASKLLIGTTSSANPYLQIGGSGYTITIEDVQAGDTVTVKLACATKNKVTSLSGEAMSTTIEAGTSAETKTFVVKTTGDLVMKTGVDIRLHTIDIKPGKGIYVEEDEPTGIENNVVAPANNRVVKFFENGKLVIMKNGKKYNAAGAILK